MTGQRLTALLVGLALGGLMSNAYAGSDLEEALAGGAERLTAGEIAGLLTGKTATFVTAEGDKRFLVYYGEGNEAAGSMVGGGWSDSGFHAVTDRNQVCLGWQSSDLPRLRCMDVLMIDGVPHKFNADGSLSGRIVEIVEGNQT